MKFAAFCALLCIGTSANAEWYKVTEGTSGTIWYLDPDRVKVVDGKVHAWVRLDASGDRSVSWRESKQLLSFDCARESYRTLSFVHYDSYGKIISSRNFSDYGYGIGYDPIVPDTVTDAVAKIACVVLSK